MLMHPYAQEELAEALRAITSICGKCEKALPKLKDGTFQHAMTAQGIEAYRIAGGLIKRELMAGSETNAAESGYTKEQLEAALAALASAEARVEKIQPKFQAGTPQHTLAVRRIRAFQIAAGLIRGELEI